MFTNRRNMGRVLVVVAKSCFGCWSLVERFLRLRLRCNHVTVPTKREPRFGTGCQLSAFKDGGRAEGIPCTVIVFWFLHGH